MPFGLSNAPATFQHLMDQVLASHKWLHCLVYLDDVLVYSGDFDSHCERLDLVLTALGDAGLCLNASKCLFGGREDVYLGHKVSGGRNFAGPTKVSGNPPPTNVKELKQLLGLASYNLKFIRGFSTVAPPLISLLKKGMEFVWHEPQNFSFKHTVDALSSPSTMVHFDETAELFLKTDASYAGLGAVLTQTINTGSLIAFKDMTLNIL
jgi:hypothetical protein